MTRDVINNSGTVVNHLTYSTFGKITSESNIAKTPFFAYTGRDWDEDLQLQYNLARWYDPVTGRWLGEDPIRFAAGDPNLSRYVSNSPTTFTDPSGLSERSASYYLQRGLECFQFVNDLREASVDLGIALSKLEQRALSDGHSDRPPRQTILER